MKDAGYFEFGMWVIFKEDCIINGRKRAAKGEKGTIVMRGGSHNFKTIVQPNTKHYPIHDAPLEIIEVSRKII